MTVIFSADDAFLGHDTGPGHPERPDRMRAVVEGIREHHLSDLLVPMPATREATDEELLAVHTPEHLRYVADFCRSGGRHLDSDTVVGPTSERLARLGSGTVLAALDVLGTGTASGAFVAVRPPGHHATPGRAMGFCLYNHVAVAAASLAARGNRVVVVDIDAHHGNGTQDIFYGRDDVMYVSWHQDQWYPFTGAVGELGAGRGFGTTVNIPLPAGATGEHYRRSVESVVAPSVEEFGADWLLVSAGFDTHREDPLCGLGLTSGDVADLVADLMELVPASRTLALLEGGYDLGAVGNCTAATVAALGGVRLHPEAPTSGGPGGRFVDAAMEARHRALG